MRAEGSPRALTVARVIASGCGAPATPACLNHSSKSSYGSRGIALSSSGITYPTSVSAGTNLRSCSSAARCSRDTCICEMPRRFAISDCDIC